MNFRALLELSKLPFEGGNQSQIIQHRRAQFARELMDDVHGLLDQLLRAGNTALETLGIKPGFLFQCGQRLLRVVRQLGLDLLGVHGVDALSREQVLQPVRLGLF